MSYRVGQGYDIHRLEVGRPFVLGGLTLDYPLGPVGHSDGDVVLHSLVDALLGALGLGDIGEWFSSTDPQWKNADSHVFLKSTQEQLCKGGWVIENVDITIFLEKPALKPYKAQMREHLCQQLDLSTHQLNIKAKTMEGLGAIGQNEAIAAAVVVLITKA